MTKFELARPKTDPDFRTWLKANPSPSLQDLVETYGGYDKIPPEVWAEYDALVKDWNLRRINRDMW